jgi:hypothetical protein
VTSVSPIGFLKMIAPNIYPGAFHTTRRSSCQHRQPIPRSSGLSLDAVGDAVGTGAFSFGRLGAEVRDIPDAFLVAIPSEIQWSRYLGGILSGKRGMKPLRFGISTFGRLCASITCCASISLFCARMYAVNA